LSAVANCFGILMAICLTACIKVLGFFYFIGKVPVLN
jgi:hypothetical protein